ncbi:MAG TPA: ATP synthase F0 subunit B, partial [Symbiobacteriaceae bacterium]|nr:ATP synthase F0 subunit B [Symbiobacteriaceae bacterium]
MDLSFLLTMGAGEVSLFPTPSDVFWTMVNFVVLLWALHRFLYKPLLGAISARETEIENSLKKAKEDRVEAERLRKDFEAQINNAQREAHEIISKATKAANAAKEQIEAE